MLTSSLCCVMLCLVAQLCPTLCDPMDCSPPGSSVHGILQSRILEWVAMPSSRGSSQPRDWTQVSCIAGKFFTTEPAREAPPSSLLLTKYQMILLWLLSSSLEMDKIDKIFLVFVIQELSLVQPFVTPQTVAFQSSLYFTTSRTLLKFISLSQWCYLTSHALPPSSFAFNLS